MGKETVLPKNIRQIGEIRGTERICLEDYVMTYIRKKEPQEKQGYMGLFLGEEKTEDEYNYVFIRGILEVPNMEMEQEEFGKYLKTECETYFPDCSVQGCCVIGTYPAARMEKLNALLPESGNLLYHFQEQEESLYRMESGQYHRIRGYFVFYEQNREMQEYLAQVFQEEQAEKEAISDQAIKSFREKVKEKGIRKNSSFLRLAGSFLVLTVLAAGAIAVNRIEDIQAIRSLTEDVTVENEVTHEIQAEPAAEIVSADAADDFPEEQTKEEQIKKYQEKVTEKWSEEPLSEEASKDMSEEAESTAALPGSDAFWEDSYEDIYVENQGETVPASARQMQSMYVIRSGDTLADICNKYYGSVERMEEICRINEITDANVIMPGQKIVLP